jgi:hypothetical protein
LTDLRWEKVLEVVVKTSGLVLIPIGKQGKRRITLPEKDVAKKVAGGSRDVVKAGEGASGYVVTAILKRTDGGKSGAVINGVFVEEGALLDFARLDAKPRLEKITSDRFIVLKAGKTRIKVEITAPAGK